MKKTELDLILEKSEKKDWFKDFEGSWIYKNDLSLRLTCNYENSVKFSREWVHISKSYNPEEIEYFIYYNNNIIYSIKLISVEIKIWLTSKITIGYPKTPTKLVVNKIDANIAKIVDESNESRFYTHMNNWDFEK